ncbi:MAG: hypothetical protein L0Z62_24660 [Gemmataceae bacterium]|nr:hypothetical protein [Gemmataceae bacterium]
MTVEQQNTKTVPGVAVHIGPRVEHPESLPRASATVSSGMQPFDSVKHLLSPKPLRRPRRSRPSEDLDELRAAEAARNFKLPDQDIMANLDRYRPLQSWYDEDEDLFGD